MTMFYRGTEVTANNVVEAKLLKTNSFTEALKLAKT